MEMAFWLLFAAVALIAPVILTVVLHNSKPPESLTGEEPAFDGEIDFYSLTDERVRELAPVIDKVGMLKRTIQQQSSFGRHNTTVETFEVFVLDTNGAIHVVLNEESRREAAKVAKSLSSTLEAPLDDPAGHCL